MTDEAQEEWPKKSSSGSATETLWSVEGRHTANEPLSLGTQIFDSRWRAIEFAEGQPGVPSSRRFSHASMHGLMSYAASQALRWWVHAEADINYRGIYFETRLIQHTLKYEYKIEQVSAHAHIHGNDRSNLMPDWGKAKAPHDPVVGRQEKEPE